jgi:DNA-binding response OmpR family regulator
MTKILVVEDDSDHRDMICMMLQEEGFETEMAIDGIDFIKKVDMFQPDLVTLDVMMPGPTTDEILEKLEEKKSNPKIILLTVIRYHVEEQKMFEKWNIVDYMKKPFDLYGFLDIVNKYIGLN